ncbi:four helix bundle protein [Heyndrickxia ginsengihumi]|uniref:four helix bundle protein n=1 Tax=Heyndrickxia ginsengihumi TaxID=363870 RepID=UPI003D22EDED
MITSYLTLQNVHKLRALQLSTELVKKVGKIIESLPFDEGHVKDQLKRASTSIVQSIAKGEQLYLKQKLTSRQFRTKSNKWFGSFFYAQIPCKGMSKYL